MAELASGAVTSLLGVLRNEWVRLGRVGDDVQFIREEMESMSSFLTHLTRAVPPGGEHDEQVRTWMNQVRQLAQDCNNCIDLYLYRGNADIHLGKAPIGRYLRWVPWFLQKMLAQHRAASELVKLKERARDVGERRTRYGVEVPKVESTSPAAASEALDVHLAGGGGHEQVEHVRGSHRITRALFGHYDLEDYLNDRLTDWIKKVGRQWRKQQQHNATQCVAVLVPTTESSGAIAREASAVADKHADNTVLVDIPALHIWHALGPKNVLYYILREIQLQRQLAEPYIQNEINTDIQNTGQDEEDERMRKWRIRREKKEVIGAIKKNIEALKVVDKIREINTDIQNVNYKDLEPYMEQPEAKEDRSLEDKISHQEPSLGVLLILLLRSASAPAAATDETKENTMCTLAECYKIILKNTAEKLKSHMDQVNEGKQYQIIHNVTQYAHILGEVFPKISKHQQTQEKDNKQVTSEATPAKDQIREIIDKVKQEILSEVFMAISDNKGQQARKTNTITETLEGKSDKKQETGPPGGPGPATEALSEEIKEKDQLATGSNPAQGQNQEDKEKNSDILNAAIKETIEKMAIIQRKIKRQLDINGIVEKIQNTLNNNDEETMVILKADEKYVSQWEQTRNALSLLPKVAVVMILTKTERNKKRAKEEYCNQPGEEPIDYYSLAALYHYIVLLIASQQKNEDSYDPQILRTILDKCESNEFCMKIFAHTLYAKPKRTKEELQKLNDSLRVLPPKSFRSNALEMLKFSYRDMPKEYQSCLLYLSIFPRGHRIRRSTLVGRWVAEGLITTDDWRWSSSAHKADECFRTLGAKGLVYPAEVSATGRVKSCMVVDLVHEFITEIAKKQLIVETRLAHHLARHFSIFNDIHLRGSEKINDFLGRLSTSSQWSRLKVLDLEGCRCFKKNRFYIKNICNNILLLKYLSLRGTDVTQLPREINNLRELEVLDIQQTEVHESATRDLLLFKLKRLLAGHTNASSSSTNTGTSLTSHVLIPEKIEKMLGMEILSNVKVKNSQDLSDIGRLWQLRKLGVAIKDKVSHANKLFEAISNLSECLWSLSIALDVTSRCNGTHNNIDPTELKNFPKFLERLSISGNILQGQLLPLLLHKVSATLIMVTLSNTSLSQINLEDLSKLPMLCCLRLRHNTYNDNKLTFKNDFKKLMYFLVESSNKIEISFEESAPELRKIVLFLDNIEAIAGLHQLGKLVELELNYNNMSSNSTSNIGGTTATTAIDHGSSTPPATAPSTVTATPVPNPSANTSPSAPNAITIASPSSPSATNAAVIPFVPTANIPSTSSAINIASPSVTSATNVAAIPSAPSVTNGATAIPSAPTATIPSTPSASNAINITSLSAPSATDVTAIIPSTTSATTIPSSPSAPNAITIASPSAPNATNATAIPLAPTSANADTIPSHPAPTSTNSTTIQSPSSPTTNTATIPSTPITTTVGASTIYNNIFSKLLSDAKQISKLTLRGTMLKEDNLRLLARMENIRHVVLLEESCHESQLVLSNDEFPKLNFLIVDCSTITGITFGSGSSPRLKKIIWTFSSTNFYGIENLPRLKELEFKGESLPDPMQEVIDKNKDRIYYTHYRPESQEVENTKDKYITESCPFIWKHKVWRRRN